MTAMNEVQQLADRLRKGDTRALSRGISWVEDDPALARELIGLVYSSVGRA